MYQQIIELSPTETLRLNWERNYTFFTVYLNGQIIGSIPDKATLKLGKNIKLPGNRQVMIILANNRLAVWQNGVDLASGTPSGTVDHFGNAVLFLIIWGVFLSVYDLLQFLQARIPLPYLILPLIVGLVVAGLGIWAKRSAEVLPLQLAVGFVALVALLRLLLFGFGPIGLIMSGALIYSLIRAIHSGAVFGSRVRRVDGGGPLDAGV